MNDQQAPSKTQRKREMHELQALGAELVELSPQRLAELPIDEDLREALREAQQLRAREAKRRQMQYIGRLMREVDPEPIRERLAAWRGVSVRHTAWLHALERWRDRLLEDDLAVEDLKREHPQADLGRLRALVRNARREREAGTAPRSARALFQALRELIPEPPAG